MRRKNPKEFWRYFKHQVKTTSTDLSADQFRAYFSKLFTDIKTNVIDYVEEFNTNGDFNLNNPSFEELNSPILHSEVVDAIHRLKRNKAPCPSDNILNEFLIETSDILSGHITEIFNKVLDSGYFPEIWAKGFVIPIHKKGDTNDPNNYRGITLLSNLGKLFTSVLTKRIEHWYNETGFVPDCQFGFRRGYSTVDAIFVLQSLVAHVLSQNLRLPCAFIDLQKAFDSVYRNALWFKLYDMGLDGKILRIFKAMYTEVKSCIKHLDSFSEFFNISVGLRQGLNNSPALFALFIADLELFLHGTDSSGLSLMEICIIMLLFADDMVIVGNSVKDLQSRLDKLYEYCQQWGLTVNTAKTKIVVFRKSGAISQNESWFYNNEPLAVVNDFTYLGVVFNYTGSFVLNNQYIVSKALRANSMLLNKISKYNVSPAISLQLFDAFVGSILNYASPVWGISKSKEIERVHLKFCKAILGVKISTCNVAVYGELGRYPMFIARYVSAIKYWFKIQYSDNILLSRIYKDALDKSRRGKKNWVSGIRNLLNMYGFSHVWDNPESTHCVTFLKIFKQRLVDCFKQEWHSDVQRKPILSHLYVHLKSDFGLEEYLKILQCKSLRRNFTRLRLSAHNLRIQSERYKRMPIERQSRLCQICHKNQIEDEFHFILECSEFRDLRHQYIKRYFYTRPSMAKLLDLFNSNNKAILTNLCKYVNAALLKRKLRLTIVLIQYIFPCSFFPRFLW